MMKRNALFFLALLSLPATSSLSAKTITLQPLDEIELSLFEDKKVEAEKENEKPEVALSPLKEIGGGDNGEGQPLGPVKRVWELDSNLSLYRNMHNWKKENEALTSQKLNLIWNLPGSISFSVSLSLKGTYKEALGQLSTAMKNTNFPVTITLNSLTNTVSFNQIFN